MERIIYKIKNNKLFSIALFIVFAIGMYLRAHLFFVNPSLFVDEALLAINTQYKIFFELFGVLDANQVAPPLFLCISKLLSNIFGFKDYIFRLPVFIFSILSMLIFPLFASKFLKSKIAIIIAYSLFSINFMLIVYSVQCKQYQTEVFFAMLCTVLLIHFYEQEKTKSESLFPVCITDRKE